MLRQSARTMGRSAGGGSPILLPSGRPRRRHRGSGAVSGGAAPSSARRGNGPNRRIRTVYDSQSGRHVAAHDESVVSLFCYADGAAAMGGGGGPEPPSPPSLEEWLADFVALREKGFMGAFVVVPEHVAAAADAVAANAAADAPQHPSPYHTQLLEALAFADPDRFTLFLPSHALSDDADDALPAATRNIANVMVDYRHGDDGDAGAAALLARHVARGHATSIALRQDMEYYGAAAAAAPAPASGDRIVRVASGVASLIDQTEGGDSAIVVNPHISTLDYDYNSYVDYDATLIRLCEELSYLDVAGPTMQSRLIVAAHNADQVKGCLAVGVNKLILDDATCPVRWEWIRTVVESQGKTIRAPTSGR